MEYFVNSLYRGLQILRAFTTSQPKMRLQELTEITGLSKTTVLRYLRTFNSLNYLKFDQGTKQYSLGPEIMTLGFSVLASMELREVALPYMEDLARLSGQNVGLGIFDNKEVVYVERIKKTRMLAFELTVGSRINAYRSSIGRAILAFMKEEDFREFLKKILYEEDAIQYVGKDGEVLIELLDKVRDKGYALNDQDLLPGVMGIAAPIFNSKGEVEGAINIPVLSQAISLEEMIKRFVPMLIDTTKMTSTARGYIQK